MKIGPGDVQAFIDIYTAFARGERAITGRPQLALLASIYDAMDRLTRPAQTQDGQQVRAPIPEGGELELNPAQARTLATVAGAGLSDGNRFCDARRALVAFALLERLVAEVEAVSNGDRS
jgi:hypothetical protein